MRLWKSNERNDSNIILHKSYWKDLLNDIDFQFAIFWTILFVRQDLQTQLSKYNWDCKIWKSAEREIQLCCEYQCFHHNKLEWQRQEWK